MMLVKGSRRGYRTSITQEERLALEAAEWVSRGELTSSRERAEFSRWLTQSPKHVREFLVALAWQHTLRADLRASQTDVDALLGKSNILPICPDSTANGRPPRSHPFRGTRRWLSAGVASAAAAIVLLAVLLGAHLLHGQVYSTDIGEQRTVALWDGSVISMNTQSQVEVDYSAKSRDIYLSTGQAIFSVAHDAGRPFRVHVNGSVVQAIGTKFDVRRDPTQTRVAVIEGRVLVSAHKDTSGDSFDSGSVAKLAAGEGIKFSGTGALPAPTPVDIKDATAWQQRRLVFVDDTLNDIVAEFARYTPTQIRIADAYTRQLRFSGVWDADRPDVLLAYLRKYGSVDVQDEDDGFVLHARADAPEL